jgi:hypothetical protein
MSAVSPDTYPIAWLADRIKVIQAQQPNGLDAIAHIRPDLQHVLRTRDIERYIQVPRGALKRPNTFRTYQRELSWFFQLWDAGQLVKAQVNGQWTLVRRDPGMAQVAPPTGAQAAPGRRLDMKIELTTDGPRLRRP